MGLENRRVAVLAYDGLCTFEFGIAVEVFALPRPELKCPWYAFEVCGVRRGAVHATGGVRVVAHQGLSALEHAGTIVIPGWADRDRPPPPRLIDALRRAYGRGARLLSICSGAFLLAASGLLDGRRATTHWRYAAELAARHPRVRVVPDVLYIDEGQLLTSAGSAAGIDLCLHLVRRDFGAEVANIVARRLVVPPHRDGGQAQFLPEPIPSDEAPSAIAPVLEWALGHLGEDLSVWLLARRARLPERTFCRRFDAAYGTSPGRWLTSQRVIAAQRLLETSTLAIEQVAQRVGLGTAANLRHHFRSQVRTTPTAYRRAFSGA